MPLLSLILLSLFSHIICSSLCPSTVTSRNQDSPPSKASKSFQARVFYQLALGPSCMGSLACEEIKQSGFLSSDYASFEQLVQV